MALSKRLMQPLHCQLVGAKLPPLKIAGSPRSTPSGLSARKSATIRSSARTSLIASQSSEAQIIARELANRDTAHQFHVAFQFSFHQAKCPLDPSLAGGS